MVKGNSVSKGWIVCHGVGGRQDGFVTVWEVKGPEACEQGSCALECDMVVQVACDNGCVEHGNAAMVT
jgi:hypothetical protein